MDGGEIGATVLVAFSLGLILGCSIIMWGTSVTVAEVAACEHACVNSGGLDGVNGWGDCHCTSGATIENAKPPEGGRSSSKANGDNE